MPSEIQHFVADVVRGFSVLVIHKVLETLPLRFTVIWVKLVVCVVLAIDQAKVRCGLTSSTSDRLSWER